MSLLLLFVGASNGTPDTHDGGWDAKTYRKYQDQLKKRAERERREFEAQQAKSATLRKDLLRLYRGIDEETIAAVAPEFAPAQKLAAKPENIEAIVSQLSALASQLSAAQNLIIREFRAEMDRQDEDEIELLLMDIL